MKGDGPAHRSIPLHHWSVCPFSRSELSVLLEPLLEFGRHSGMPMASRCLDSLAQRVLRVLRAVELLAGIGELAPGIPLVVVRGQVCLEVLPGLIPQLGL